MKYDLEKLDSIDSTNPNEVKDLQKFLKERGFYVGPKTDIDGNWGGKTIEGVSKLRDELKETAKTARDTAVANQETNSPLNNALRGATEFGPYAGGALLGMWGGHKAGQGMSSLWAKDAAATKAMANDPKISGVVGESKMGGMRTARNTITGSQFLAPAALLGSAEFIRGHVAPNFEGETKKWINLGANADQGAGLGLAAHQLFDLKNRISSPADAADEARIETRAAGEKNPPAPPTTRPNSERLITAAKAAGATGKMTKAEAADYLAKNVTEANRAAVLAELPASTTAKTITSTIKRLASKPGSSSIIAPLVGGLAAYDAASGEAKAAGASPSEAVRQGAVAAAPAAGAGYGLAKLLQKLPAGLAEASAPAAVDAMTNYTPEDLNQARNWLARNAPFLAFGAVGDARNMAQIPERNMGKTPELPNAAALQIPEGIPTPNPDGSSPYPELLAPMGAGPQLPQQVPPMPMRRPQLPYAPMGFAGRY